MDLNDEYHKFQVLEATWSNTTTEYLYSLWNLVYQSHQQKQYSKPMPWIGMYIALASLLCVLAMVADLLHGLRNRKLWFPCKYFTLNAASLTVIAVAIKLPMDPNNLMPSLVDQATKFGSMSFMCTMMANLLPSLAIKDNKGLVSNIIALALLVISLVVNFCIQISTGILFFTPDDAFYPYKISFLYRFIYVVGCVVPILMLLIIYACSSLAILKSKQILESKYQTANRTALKDPELKAGRLTVEKLKQYVSNYWIMAGTGSPQFMTACSATTSAAGVICVASTGFLIYAIIINFPYLGYEKQDTSDYKWSMLVIFIIQSVGVILGTIAPLARCFATLSFELSINRIWKQIKVSKVESYWTQKLYDWKHSRIPFPSGSRFQKTVVVACKMITMIIILFLICVLCCRGCWKWLKAMFSPSHHTSGQQPKEQLGKDKDLRGYVLQLENDIQFTERTLKRLLKSVNRLIQKAEKQQPKNLMKLLSESRGFEGLAKFDSNHVPFLLSQENVNCWSLPLVTLTCIAMSLPDIQKNMVDCLLNGVSEGLLYVTLVEESVINATDHDHAGIQKAAETLWVEVEVYHKWLGTKLPNPTSKVNTPGDILQWLRDKAKNKVLNVENMDITDPNDNWKYKSICANSMYRITETILLSYHENIKEVNQEELFSHVSSMIADIIAACLTNLPQVILMKCHESVIEKREASVQAAAQLLGETTQIIITLQDRQLPRLNPDELAFIDKWCAYLTNPFP
ncbi:hypothetical protein Lser_V15G28613 [Lactuca serriola]